MSVVPALNHDRDAYATWLACHTAALKPRHDVACEKVRPWLEVASV